MGGPAQKYQRGARKFFSLSFLMGQELLSWDLCESVMGATLLVSRACRST